MYRRGLTVEPFNPSLWMCIGFIFRRYGDIDNAEQAFIRCLTLDSQFPDRGEVFYELGLISKQRGDFPKAVSSFYHAAEAWKGSPRAADAYFSRGFSYELSRNFPEAIESFETALSINPHHSRSLQHLGWMLHCPPHSDSGAAVKVLARAAACDYRDEQTWYLLGRVFMALGKYSRAHECYSQALLRDPFNPAIWCSVGVMYFYVHQYDEALQAYSRAISITPKLAEIWYDLGTLYEAVGQLEDALSSYNTAAALHPRNTQLSSRVYDISRKIQSLSAPTAVTKRLPADDNAEKYPTGTNKGFVPVPKKKRPSRVPPTSQRLSSTFDPTRDAMKLAVLAESMTAASPMSSSFPPAPSAADNSVIQYRSPNSNGPMPYSNNAFALGPSLTAPEIKRVKTEE
ncbi:hypothetical protein GEMRC1_002500 [Eukaryota sp. GEM-RC1]